MSKTAETPFVPRSLEHLVDEEALAAHQELASQSLSDYMAKDYHAVQKNYGGGAHYIDIRPEVDHDEKDAIVVPLPFANGYEPHLAMRADLISKMTGRRVVVFPNTTVTSKPYSLGSQEAEAVSQGDFRPVAEKQFRSLSAAGIERFGVAGYSQGASIGAASLRLAGERGYFDVGSSALMEAPNVVERTGKQLSAAFRAGGMGPLRRDMNQSAVPMLSEATHSAGGAVSYGMQIKDVLTLARGTGKDINKTISQGFEHDTFGDDIEAALLRSPNLHLLIVNAAESKIMPAADADRLEERFSGNPAVQFQSVENYGHTMGDNIFVHALLARAGLQA